MKKPKLSLICSIARNQAIGHKNRLLWDIPEDLKHFRDMTMGHVVLMGAKTFESIGRLLPGRTNIVISDDSNYHVPGGVVCHSINDALINGRQLEKNGEIFAIGGGQIYNQTISKADKLYLTIVEGKYKADTYFPDYSDFKKIIKEEKHDTGKYRYTFFELER